MVNKEVSEILEDIKKAPSFMGGNEKYINCSQSSALFLEDVSIIEKDLETLEQYKNIETKLGIDLITFFEALTDGVWVKNEVGQIYHTNVYLHNLILSPSSTKNNFCFITPDNVLLLFNRIKQDWALTKEELLWD